MEEGGGAAFCSSTESINRSKEGKRVGDKKRGGRVLAVTLRGGRREESQGGEGRGGDGKFVFFHLRLGPTRCLEVELRILNKILPR